MQPRARTGIEPRIVRQGDEQLRPLAHRRCHEGAIEHVRARFPTHTIVLKVHGDAPPPSVWADARMVRQALINLLVNAVQASPDGVEVSVEIAAADAAVRLTVIDRGLGVPEGARDRIFEPFFTTKASGTGLGLAVVQRVAEAHGGEVLVSPTEGGGSTFSLVLRSAAPA